MAGSFEIKGVKEATKEWGEFNKELVSSLDLIEKQILSADKLSKQYKEISNLKGLAKFTTQIKKNNDDINKSLNVSVVANKKLAQATKALQLAQSDEGKELTKVRLQVQKLNKENKQSAEISLGLVGSYRKLSAELNKVRIEAKNAAVTFGTNSKEFKKLAKDANVLDAKLKGIDSTLGQSQRNVGNYGSSLKNLSKNLLGSLGVVGGMTAFVSIMKQSFDIVKAFDKQQAVLAGVLGVTRSQISGLTEDAKRLGSTTAFTATEVGQLQEAYARLGFSQEEIIASTEATLNGALALQSGLAESAELVGSTLRQFELEATESARVVDVLSKSTQISALNFGYLQTALPVVGKTAKTAGVGVELLSAQLGVLASNGIQAGSAAAQLRNIYLKSSKAGLTYEQAMNKIATSQNKMNTASALFGVQGATVAITLSENTKKVQEYANKLVFAGGTAEKLAKEQLNTLDGSLKLLSSAWEGYILGMNDATGASSIFQKGIKFLADNLKTILDGIIFVAKAFGIYKAVVIASGLAQKAYTLTTKSLTASIKAMNTAQKANTIGIIIVAVYAAVEAFKYYSKEMSIAQQAQKNFNDISVKAEQGISKERTSLKLLVETARDENLSKEQRLSAIKAINKISPEYLGNITLENINTQEANNALKAYLGTLRKVTLQKALESKMQELENKKLELQSTAVKDSTKWHNVLYETIKNGGNTSNAVVKNIKNRADEIKSIEKQKKALEDLYKEKVKSGEIDLAPDKIIEPTSTGSKKKKESFKGDKQVAIQLKTNKKLVDLSKKLNVSLKKSDLERVSEFEKSAQRRLLADEETNEKQKQLAIDFAKDTATILGESFGMNVTFMDGLFKNIEDGFTNAKDVIETAGAVINDVSSAIFSASNERYEKQLSNNEKERESALDNASLTNEQKEYLEEKYDKKKAEIQRKQAQAEKKQAIFKIGLSTAMGIAKAVASSPLTFGLPFSGFIAAMGAIQIAAVASKKVPEFWKGTDNAPRGLAKTDERGAELHLDRFGRIKDLGSDKGAQYKWLEQGDKIITADKTRDILQSMNTNDIVTDYSKNVNPNIDYSTILNVGGSSISKSEMEEVLLKSLSKQPKNIITLDRNGINNYYVKGRTVIKKRD